MKKLFRVIETDYLNHSKYFITVVTVPYSITDLNKIIEYAENELNRFKGVLTKYYKVVRLLN